MHIITDSQNFEARKIALTRNVFNNKKTNIELYELSSSDRNLLNHIGQNISIKEMFPKKHRIREPIYIKFSSIIPPPHDNTKPLNEKKKATPHSPPKSNGVAILEVEQWLM